MKSCHQCGMQNTSDAAFCRGCGSRLAASESAVKKTALQNTAEDAPVVTPPNPVVHAPASPPRNAVDAQLSAQMGRSSRTLWGALAAVALIIIGGLGWLLGRGGQSSTAPPSELIGSTPTSAVSSSSSDSPQTPDSSTSVSPGVAPTQRPVPIATPERWAGERYPQTRTRLLSELDISGWSFDEVRYASMRFTRGTATIFKPLRFAANLCSTSGIATPRVPGRSQNRAESLFSATEAANRRLLMLRRDQLRGGHGG
jgi:hypothetical protein